VPFGVMTDTLDRGQEQVTAASAEAADDGYCLVQRLHRPDPRFPSLLYWQLFRGNEPCPLDLEHPSIMLKQLDRQAAAQLIESGAISCRPDESIRPEGALAPDGGAFRLQAGDRLSADSYFNSFYEAFWIAHAPLADLALRLSFGGALTVTVYREYADGSRRQIVDQPIDAPAAAAGRSVLVPIPSPPADAAAGRSGRLYAEITARSDGVLHDAAFVTSTAPRQAVRLAVGLCTYNREADIKETLRAITVAEDLRDTVHRVFLVNQGDPFAHPDIAATIAADHRITVIHQCNLGGCGGFTRCMVEALAEGDAFTHILLMDDDIVIDCRVIETSRAFLSYCVHPLVLGGAMLDRQQPTVVFESGARLSADNRVQAIARNLDLASERALSQFARPSAIDYNAWWFCLLPLAEVAKVALPAPIFLRGDDIEFGHRLARNGVPTVTLPGIAVWHEPFYARPIAWQKYYELRNRLIFAACYRDKVHLDTVGSLLGLLLNDVVLRGDGATFAMKALAVGDFLRGPEALFAERPDRRHARLAAMARGDQARNGPGRRLIQVAKALGVVTRYGVRRATAAAVWSANIDRWRRSDIWAKLWSSDAGEDELRR
jgi:galactofuranosylgalactofuranosylrhamnosyl-N-acetylglucosaminyl-diphospho-decaprenol beta-1,5/1,6-galactofuranosyltransferase